MQVAVAIIAAGRVWWSRSNWSCCTLFESSMLGHTAGELLFYWSSVTPVSLAVIWVWRSAIAVVAVMEPNTSEMMKVALFMQEWVELLTSGQKWQNLWSWSLLCYHQSQTVRQQTKSAKWVVLLWSPVWIHFHKFMELWDQCRNFWFPSIIWFWWWKEPPMAGLQVLSWHLCWWYVWQIAITDCLVWPCASFQ